MQEKECRHSKKFKLDKTDIYQLKRYVRLRSDLYVFLLFHVCGIKKI